MFTGIIAGTIIGGLLYLRRSRRALWLSAAGLIVTGLLYVLFAALGQPSALPLEIAGALIMVAFAVTGVMCTAPG